METVTRRKDIPDSIAIAGIYGYIGSKIYQAALELGIRKIYGIDFGNPDPSFPSSSSLEMIAKEDEERFYDLDADLFHIALHPKHRKYLGRLLERGCHVTCEKPMADPENPEACKEIMDAAERGKATLLFDFLELYSPMTCEIVKYLSNNSANITNMILVNTKDREDPTNPRNRKIMVPIQYQESVHQIAFILYLEGKTKGSDFEMDDLLNKTIALFANSDVYDPPNPEDYSYCVDGFVNGHMLLGRNSTSIFTNFKRGSNWTKKKIITGEINGSSHFKIDAEYLPGNEHLMINHESVAVDGDISLYRNVIKKGWQWHTVGFDSICPDAKFAYWTFALSAGLWKASHKNTVVEVHSKEDLEALTRAFPSALEQGKFARY